MRRAAALLPLLTLLLTAAPADARSTAFFPHADALVDTLLALRDASRPDRVDSLATPAIAAARDAADSTRLQTLLLIRGATRAGFGQARRAEADLREARDLAVARDDTTGRLQAIRWLSVALGRQGRSDEARSLYDALADLAVAAGDSVHLGWAWVGQAYDHYLQGRTAAADSTYGLAAGVLERHGEPDGATWAWNGRGLALRQAGRYRAARAAFAHVVLLSEQGGHPVNTALALDQLGRLDLQLGDPAGAVELFARSAAIHRAHRHHREGLVPSIDLAQALIMQGRFAEAEARLDSVLAVTRDLGLRDLEILAQGQLVDAWLDQGRPGRAAQRCREVLAEGALPSRMSATEIQLRLARALADRGESAAAVEVLGALLDAGTGAASLRWRTVGLLGALLVDLDRAAEAAPMLRRAAAEARTADAGAERVILETHLGRAEEALGRRDAALAAYRGAMDAWERVRAWAADPVWREQRGTVAGSLFAHAAAALLAGPGGLDEAWAAAQRHKARTLQERMLGPGRAPPRDAPADLAAFRRDVLHADEVLLDLVEGERLGVLFCVTRDTAWAAVVPGRRASAPRLQRLVDVVTSRAVDDPEPAAALAAQVVAVWPESMRRAAATGRCVLWSPDGVWHRLPTALLPWEGWVARVPSAGVLARLRAADRPPPPHASVYAVAGPDPDEDDAVLPGADAEVRWLDARLRDVRVVRAPDGTSFDWRAWEDADVLHLATHTVLDLWQPWNTAITLGRGAGGSVLARDVCALRLRARLAVLAGCTTVGARTVGGEGLIGLAGAFLAARTPAVLATLWPVDDAVALPVASRFYEGLADGLTAAQALERARRALRRDPVGAAPRHWAAFVLVGDGDVTVPVRRRTPRWPVAAGLGLLALGAFVRSRR